MDAEKKQTQPDKTELIKSISTLLDDTIAQVESMAKGEVSFSDLKLQPDENGDMPGEAGSKSDQFQSMKKEDEEEKKETLEKEIPEELSEAKDDDDDEKKKKDKDDDEDAEKACKSEEEEDPEFTKFLGYVTKAIEQGVFDIVKDDEEPVKKSEEDAKAEDLEKSEAKEDDELKKALESRDAEVKELKEQISGLTETVEKMSRVPQGRKSVSGLKPIRKSENDVDGGDEQPLNKNEVLDKLLDAQKAGDKRVTQSLITQYELSANPALVKDILTGK